MKKCSHCGYERDDAAAYCSGCKRTVRLGVILAALPIVAFAVGFTYLCMVPYDTIHAPEELGWRVLSVELVCVCIAALCLISSFALLAAHFKRSPVARWALAWATTEALLILGLIIYDIAA